MAERFDVSPLIAGLLSGLRKRRSSGDETADWPARLALFGIPLVAAGLVLALSVELDSADQFLAAAAILAGALIAAFSQVASWREQLLRRRRRVDGVRVRALTEAAAHILVSILVSVAGSVAVFIAANIELHCAPLPVHVAARVLSAVIVACFTYIGLSLIIVTNLLWDALTAEEDDARRDSLKED